MSSNGLKMHEFKPGQSGNPRGRPRGVPNKNSQRKRDAIKRAMERLGDEDGKGGLVGFLMRVARAHPFVFFQEACKLEPKMVAAAIDEQFNVSIQYQSPEEARAALVEAGIILDAKPVRTVIAAAESQESISQESTPAAESPESPESE